MAIIDFESYCEHKEQEDFSPNLAVAPLVNYIKKFGLDDWSNVWRLNMIIAQVYQDHLQWKQALKYIEASYQTAPKTVQPDIEMMIEHIKIKMQRQQEFSA